MVDYEKQFEVPAYAERSTQIATTFKIVYGWMAVGLALSGLIAWYTFTSGLWQKILTGPGMTICIVAELALVFVLSAAIRKLPEGIAYLLFIGYYIISIVYVAVKRADEIDFVVTEQTEQNAVAIVESYHRCRALVLGR